MDDGGPALDVDQQIQVETELVRLRTLDGSFGVTAVLRIVLPGRSTPTPVAQLAAPSASTPTPQLKDDVVEGQTLRHTASGGLQTPTVDVTYATGRFGRRNPPGKTITAAQKAYTWPYTVAAMFATTDDSLCSYDLTTKFNPPTVV